MPDVGCCCLADAAQAFELCQGSQEVLGGCSKETSNLMLKGNLQEAISQTQAKHWA